MKKLGFLFYLFIFIFSSAFESARATDSCPTKLKKVFLFSTLNEQMFTRPDYSVQSIDIGHGSRIISLKGDYGDFYHFRLELNRKEMVAAGTNHSLYSVFFFNQERKLKSSWTDSFIPHRSAFYVSISNDDFDWLIDTLSKRGERSLSHEFPSGIDEWLLGRGKDKPQKLKVKKVYAGGARKLSILAALAVFGVTTGSTLVWAPNSEWSMGRTTPLMKTFNYFWYDRDYESYYDSTKNPLSPTIERIEVYKFNSNKETRFGVDSAFERYDPNQPIPPLAAPPILDRAELEKRLRETESLETFVKDPQRIKDWIASLSQYPLLSTEQTERGEPIYAVSATALDPVLGAQAEKYIDTQGVLEILKIPEVSQILGSNRSILNRRLGHPIDTKTPLIESPKNPPSRY